VAPAICKGRIKHRNRWTRLPGLLRDNPLKKFVRSQGIGEAGKKERRSVTHKRLVYYFNVNRTSLDHLLLGENADVDKNVE
jgi:hypothetical protein